MIDYILSYIRSFNSSSPLKIFKIDNKPSNKKYNANNSLSRPAPYAKLKNGSKSAIIAVVDNGTISFQRFGQSGFEELPWVGDGFPAKRGTIW